MKTKWAVIVWLVCGLLATTGCRSMSRKESKVVLRTVEIPAGGIRGIVASGGWDIKMNRSDTSSASLTYSAELEEGIVAEVREDGYLYLGYKKSNKLNLRRAVQRATINLPVVELLDLSGASDVVMTGTFSHPQCRIDMSGAAELDGLTFEGERLQIELSGASDCDVTGRARLVELSASGASDIDLLKLTADTLTVDLSGASEAKVTVNHHLSGELSGASELRYRGDATPSVRVSGASEIHRYK